MRKEWGRGSMQAAGRYSSCYGKALHWLWEKGAIVWVRTCHLSEYRSQVAAQAGRRLFQRLKLRIDWGS